MTLTMNDAELMTAYRNLSQVELEREMYVAKSKAMVERARMDLSLQELRLLQYVLSKVKPDDTIDTEYTISIKRFLQVCGLEVRSGESYNAVKRQIDSLWSHRFWMMDESGREVGVQWITKPVLDRAAGTVSVRLDPDVQDWVIGLIGRDRYIQYKLLAILPMRSVYSVKLYELLKAQYNKREVTFPLEDLRGMLCSGSGKYPNFKDFRRRVLDTAKTEINAYSDLFVAYEPVYTGHRVTAVRYTIRHRSVNDKIMLENQNNELLNAGYTLADFL